MKNVVELRQMLSENIKEVIAGTRSVDIAKEVANTAGKIISSLSVQHKSYERCESQQQIEFLKEE